MRAVDSAHMRAQNLGLVFRLIWSEHEISRAEVARRTGLSRSTVSDIVNELMAANLVVEHGAGNSQGGRRPIILRLNEGAFAFAGIDLGTAHVGIVMTTIRGELLLWRHEDHDVFADPQGALALVQKMLNACVEAEPMRQRSVVGLGVAVPSPVDPVTRGKVSDLILPHWQGIDIQQQLAAATGLPVFVENDADVGALAEQWWGAGRDGGDLVFIKLAAGIGAGIIINGNMHRGSAGFSGELGHMIIAPDDTRALRGLRGCLAAYVGADALCERARELGVTSFQGEAERARPTAVDLADAALAGDASAAQIVRDAASYLGIAVANVLNLLNPRTVVLGGALTKAGPLLLEPLAQTVQQRTLWPAMKALRLVVTQLGEHNVAIGAATRVIEAGLADPPLLCGQAPSGDVTMRPAVREARGQG